ncbi:tyrosine-type recombinase/integrase [Caryophanon tenue]|uniref:Tyr recombinase domain-containing protein n=1 Tax=Caryophanon tenue TaxID=33978 RepID=A0A1C0YCV2_9BACL|nr:site-specific integrase [Caryophanon tenue]OCS85008.1 hypothetical protein A6M13_14085 [Caryophanon tenue]
MEEKIIHLHPSLLQKQAEADLQKIQDKRRDRYKYDMKHFVLFCDEHMLAHTYDSLKLYLHHSITQQRIKFSTFERRLAGIKFHLKADGQQPTEQQLEDIRLLRDLYNQPEYLRLKPQIGQRAEKQDEVLRLIDRFDTDDSLDIRIRAICLVNLITACRPTEMVRIQLKDFDLRARTVWTMQTKQGSMVEKRLTLECIQAVDRYIRTFSLQPEHFFVGKVDKWGHYHSTKVHESSYNRMITKWLGFAPYTFRKTQITSMYNKGADIPTIAKQSGHKSHQTIMEHYIQVRKEDVDEFL